MKVAVSIGCRFAVDPEGELWVGNSSADYQFWARYLDVYDEVLVLGRTRPCQRPPDGWQRAGGPGVRAAPLPDFHLPMEMARNLAKTRRIVNEAIADAPAVILRIPCLVGDIVYRTLRRSSHPFGVEVLGDPHDSLAPGASKLRLRAFYRWWFAGRLRKNCAGACAATYVTESALQRRYPAQAGALSTYCSDVCLPDETIASHPRDFSNNAKPTRLIMVGTLNALYKAPHILIDAVRLCTDENVDLRMTFVGGGRHKAELEQRVQQAGLNSRIRFLGHFASRQAVQDELDRSDVFMLPSFQEGLPRAMVEAMARGLPCIGSTVGGIPELLAPEDMVEPGNAQALAAKIREVATDPARMNRMSTRNLAKANDYRDAVLRERRKAFYGYVRDRTERWLARS